MRSSVTQIGGMRTAELASLTQFDSITNKLTKLNKLAIDTTNWEQ